MSSGLRTYKSWPFARGSPRDSVGEFRGTLGPSLALVGLSGVCCWEAKGDARKVFDSGLRTTIIDFLKKHSDKAQESGSYLSVALLMVGRRPAQTKPTVMFVSDDKAARKEAFNLIKDSNIMTKHPGFEVGHTDFEKLMALGGDAAVEIFSMPRHDRAAPHHLFHFPPEGSGLPVRMATAGGIVSHRGRYMYLTVGHFLDDALPVDPDAMEGVVQDADSDCEITGLDNSDDDETSFVDATSQGSVSGADDDDGSDKFSYESSHSTESAANTPVPLERSRSGRSLLGSSFDSQPELASAFKALAKRDCALAGRLVLRSKGLDYALIEADATVAKAAESSGMVASLDDLHNIESAPHETTVIGTAPDGRAIRGTLSGATHDVRLPGSDEFTAVYSVRFDRPLLPGDCGSWVRDAETGAVFGHVFAGSPRSGLAVVMPASIVFGHAKALLGWLSEQVPATTPSSPSSSHDQEIPRVEPLAGWRADDEIRLLQLEAMMAQKGKESELIEKELQAARLAADIRESHEEAREDLDMCPSTPADFLHQTTYGFQRTNAPRDYTTSSSDWMSSCGTLISESGPSGHPAASGTEKPPSPVGASRKLTTGQRRERSLSGSSTGSSMTSLKQRAREALVRQNQNMTRNIIAPKPPDETSSRQDNASGGRDGTANGKNPASKQTIAKAKYERPKHPRVYCTHCREHPDGFRGEHELRRHVEAKHKTVVKKWICRDPATVGIPSSVEAVTPLSSCKHCSQGRQYSANYNAAAHLRRTHFRTNPKAGRPPDRGGPKGEGMGGWLSMSELRDWMVEVTVPRDDAVDEPSVDVDTMSDPDLAPVMYDMAWAPDSWTYGGGEADSALQQTRDMSPILDPLADYLSVPMFRSCTDSTDATLVSDDFYARASSQQSVVVSSKPDADKMEGKAE